MVAVRTPSHDYKNQDLTLTLPLIEKNFFMHTAGPGFPGYQVRLIEFRMESGGGPICWGTVLVLPNYSKLLQRRFQVIRDVLRDDLGCG